MDNEGFGGERDWPVTHVALIGDKGQFDQRSNQLLPIGAEYRFFWKEVE